MPKTERDALVACFRQNLPGRDTMFRPPGWGDPRVFDFRACFVVQFCRDVLKFMKTCMPERSSCKDPHLFQFRFILDHRLQDCQHFGAFRRFDSLRWDMQGRDRPDNPRMVHVGL